MFIAYRAVLYGESEKSLRELVNRFGKVRKRRSLKVNVKEYVMMVGEESMQCEINF